MYSVTNIHEGSPPRLYRSTEEIRRDMMKISTQIRENEEKISLHNLIMEMLPSLAEKDPEKWISQLRETICEADEALDNLKRLKFALDELVTELDEVRRMMGFAL